MSEETKAKKSSLSDEELERLAVIFREAVKSSKDDSASLAKTLAEAIAESRKPYTSPQELANRAASKKSSKEQAERQKRTKDYEQDACKHVKGSNPNSFRSDPFDSSIAKHVMDTGEVVGICTNCTRIFSSMIETDIKWLREKSSNQTSMAGRREFADANAAKRARLGLDQKEIFADSEGNLLDHDPKKPPACREIASIPVQTFSRWS